MSKQKKDLTLEISNWFFNLVKKLFEPEYVILESATPSSILAKVNSAHLKKFDNYSSWEFRPDIYVVLKNIKSGKQELCISNRSDSALSLKEIGELKCYSQIVESKLSLLISPRGTSTEVGILLSDKDTQDRLLKFDNNTILIGTWDETTKQVQSESIIPFGHRSLIDKINVSNKRK